MLDHLLATVAVVAALFVTNMLHNRWAKRHYMVVCFVATGLLLMIARIDDLAWRDMGLGINTWRDGLIWSAVVFAAVALFYAIAASLPFARKGFADKRAVEQGWPKQLYESTIRIPFGTAVLEETAFRGVLLAVLVSGWGWWPGVIVSSILFGLWHIYPALDFHENSEVAEKLPDTFWGKAVSVIGNVIATGIAGVVFCLLLGFTGSLFPVIVLHASLNGIGMAVSWAFGRRLREI